MTACICSNSSSLDWRICAFCFITCWNTRASSPSSPPMRGQPSAAAMSSVSRRSARRSSWRSGRSSASVTSRITRPPITATAEPIHAAWRRPAVGPPSSTSAGALRNTTQSASGTPADATMLSPRRPAEPCGSIGLFCCVHWSTTSWKRTSSRAAFISHARVRMRHDAARGVGDDGGDGVVVVEPRPRQVAEQRVGLEPQAADEDREQAALAVEHRHRQREHRGAVGAADARLRDHRAARVHRVLDVGAVGRVEVDRAHAALVGHREQHAVRGLDEHAVEHAAQHALVVEVGEQRRGVVEARRRQLRRRLAHRVLHRHHLGRQHDGDAFGVRELGIEHRALAALRHRLQHEHDRQRDAARDQDEAGDREPRLQRAGEVVQALEHVGAGRSVGFVRCSGPRAASPPARAAPRVAARRADATRGPSSADASASGRCISAARAARRHPCRRSRSPAARSRSRRRWR